MLCEGLAFEDKKIVLQFGVNMAVKIEGMAALQANIRKLANQVAPKAAAKSD